MEYTMQTLLPVSVFYMLVFLTGGALASFAGVVAYRLPRGLSFLRGRSFCPTCREPLLWVDMIPVFSWLVLGGKCRRCRADIPVRHLLSEALGGTLAVLPFVVFGMDARAPAAACFLLCLLAASLFDLATMEIPNSYILALALPALALAALATDGVAAHLAGSVVFPLPLFATALIVKDSFGGGDIKLAAVCGLALGWELALAALFFSLLAGGGYACWQLLLRRMRRGQHFAFGPYLALGAGIALLWGEPAVRWYASLLSF